MVAAPPSDAVVSPPAILGVCVCVCAFFTTKMHSTFLVMGTTKCGLMSFQLVQLATAFNP